MELELQFSEVVQMIQQARANAYKAVNTELVNCYWQVGAYISKRLDDADWGDKTINELAKFIERKHPDLKGYGRRGLYRMRQFYEIYKNSSLLSSLLTQESDNQKNIIVSPAVSQFKNITHTILAKISWTHHLIILSRTKMTEEREFYIQLCIRENYSKRELDRQISAGLFERATLGNQNLSPAVRNLNKATIAVFKDSYVFDFLNLPNEHNETDLQKALIAPLKYFSYTIRSFCEMMRE